MAGIQLVHVPYKGSPPAVADLMAGEVALMFSPSRQFAVQGIETIGGTPVEFAAYIREATAKWAKVIKLSGARAE